MEWWYHIPIVTCTLWVFALGLGIGSFLNVLIARMPFDKSIVWPGSRCGACYRPLRLTDNLPILGYLRLGGKCRFCGTKFSSRYLWIELATGLVFVALFLIEVVFNWHNVPGLVQPFGAIGQFPSLRAWLYFAALAFLFSMLIAAATIDLHYRIIPLQLTYVGTLIGILASTLGPWPWPSDVGSVPLTPPGDYGWTHFQLTNKIPAGLALWPFWGPPPAWAPAGSWQLGFLTGLMGAAVGQFIGRSAKWLFEIGFQQEALGLGDADLLMMIGSFLGWQITVLALPAGAFVLLPILIPWMAYNAIRGKQRDPHIPFGPGIAAGAVACWLAWPTLGEASRFVFFSPLILMLSMSIVGGGLLIFGLILRRGPAVEAMGSGNPT
ncbi:prepilin peptidase [Limnoglobus roseus]|uniref:Prepilin peptidase n=1 Tax=Limnoglobus roseus TaxID=2598579 RepID=A0A5C1AB90_9BACT|nr:A24 family peptidase [Limnoglobus roseus]QEL15845.1 prepilin peptidase [Limnoglobus roseus]